MKRIAVFALVLTVSLCAVPGGAQGVCPCSIWSSTATPGVADGGPDSPVELGVQFRSDVNGYITGVRFYKSVANVGTHVANLWTSAGALLATATFVGESASGWQQVNFSSPVAITAGNVYVASYHTTSGHYAYDQFYFAGRSVDNSPLHAPQDTSTGHNGVFLYGAGGFPAQSWNSTNYWVDVVFETAATPPTVQSTSPNAGASGVDTQSSITATFSEALNATTVNGTSMQLLDPSSSVVASTVSYVTASSTATLTPNAALLNSTTYTVVLKGGVIKDVAGNALVSDYTWTFTTAAPPPPPPISGPGGPILIVSSSTNPFSQYCSEILRNEGFNEFTAMDISLVSDSILAGYDLIILGNFPLTATQASMFTTWVDNGGNLIAMRPDSQLASLFGLAGTSTVLSDAYLLMNTASGPANGLVGETVQFHGSADVYNLNGATALATLYSSAATPTPNPAVTLNHAGLGQAAAFTYDLARSVVYTRQGNPAWSAELRDGQNGPIRSDNLYYGAASFDPQPDYVDRTKIAIPQADEQQRLLANLIVQMNLGKRPLPRFWYFPRDLKAAVVMTGDDHGAMYGGGATAARFDHFLSLSPSGCSVPDWQCVRASAYLIAPALAGNPLTNAQASSYIAQGFEVGVHVDSVPDCSNWTPSQLASFYSTQISSFLSKYASAPQPKTHRMHCVGWSDYDSQPQTELQNGIRLDTNYYYWPPSWVNDTPGMFTGSGVPMRFTKRDGTMLDIYQATTQMTDESGQSYPLHIDTLLDNALGASGFYGYFTANMHNDTDTSAGADYIVASAQSRGVPIISAAQLLTWLDGRNGSSFTTISWNGSTLTFGIAVGLGANGLQAMLPATLGPGTLSSVTLNGSAVAFNRETIKGILYAVFPAAAGNYQATYTGTTVSYGITGNISGVGGSGAIVTLSGASTATTTADSSGTYNFTGLSNGSYSVTPTSTGYVFSPASQAVTLNNANARADFTSTQLGYSIAGSISGPGGPGATVTLGGASSAITTADPAGNYKFAGLTNGTYIVTPSNSGFVLSPSSQTTAISDANVAGLNFTSLPTLTSVTLSPTSLVGGSSSIGALTLSGPAPAGGAVVTLSSSNPTTALVPASITIPASASAATFSVTTSAVASDASVIISATYNTTQSTNLAVAAATLSGITVSPASLLGGSTSTGTATLNGPAPAGGATVMLSSSNTGAAQVPASILISAGATTATFAVTTTPVASNTGVTITGSLGVFKIASLTVTAATLAASGSGVSVSPASVIGGTGSTGTVRLTGPAPAGGAIVTLSSSNGSAAQIPATVTIAANATSATFVITTSPVASNTSVSITAVYGVTRTAALTVTAATLSSVSLSPSSVIGGTSSTGTVNLTGPAPAGGASVSVSSSNTRAAQVPASVTVPGNSRTATFTVTTSPVSSNTSVTITGTRGVSRTASLSVSTPVVRSITLNPTSVRGGSSSTATITISGPAPTAGTLVGLSSSNTTTATVPSSVTVAAGATSATVTVTTQVVTTSRNVTISAVKGGTVAAILAVTP